MEVSPMHATNSNDNCPKVVAVVDSQGIEKTTSVVDSAVQHNIEKTTKEIDVLFKEKFRVQTEAYTEVAENENIDEKINTKVEEILNIEDKIRMKNGSPARLSNERGKRKEDLTCSTKATYLKFRSMEFYSKYLDQSACELDYPIQPYHIIESQINDLLAYRDDKECHDKNKIDLLIETLRETQKISNDMAQVLYGDSIKKEMRVPEEDRKNWVDQEFGKIADGVSKKLEQLTPGQMLVIHGGTRDHSVVYQFVKGEGNTYTLNVINTDDQPRNFIEFITGKKWGNELQNFSIKNIPAGNISSEFLKKLLLFKDKSISFGQTRFNGPTSQIYDLLKTLGEPEYSGESYIRQQSKTCTTRCVSELISQTIGKEEFVKFHKFSLRKNLGRLPALSEIAKQVNNSVRLEKVIGSLQEIGKEELAKRETEAAQNIHKHKFTLWDSIRLMFSGLVKRNLVDEKHTFGFIKLPV